MTHIYHIIDVANINTFFIYVIIIPILGFLLLFINFLFQDVNDYPDKAGAFECGLTSFNQTRTAVSIAFILIAILFLPFDLEISSVLPFSLSLYYIDSYGIFVLIIFLILLTIGFAYEINKGAIKIVNRDKTDLYNSIIKE